MRLLNRNFKGLKFIDVICINDEISLVHSKNPYEEILKYSKDVLIIKHRGPDRYLRMDAMKQISYLQIKETHDTLRIKQIRKLCLNDSFK